MMMKIIVWTWSILITILICSIAAIIIILRSKKLFHKSRKTTTVGFFHPYCNAGGGGERVLWCAVQAIQAMKKDTEIVIYARNTDCTNPNDVIERAESRFNVQVDAARLRFISLKYHSLIAASTYKRLTLIGQSFGSGLLAVEALWKFLPDTWIDTMGFSFTYPVAWFSGCRVGCYTHYPTVSTDMLQRVVEQRPAYNNDDLISRHKTISIMKYYYYLSFCQLYYLCSIFASVVMVNSNWTRAHIDSLWHRKSIVVYPPCDTDDIAKSQKMKKQRVLVSLGQFRPEKDHRLQIQTMSKLRELLGNDEKMPKLLLFGSCRDQEDEDLVKDLKQYRDSLQLTNYIDFKVNLPYSTLKSCICTALIGIHTMWNEHFGIAPVELMAAGTILIAHNSGGPKVDIIQNGRTGYLAETAEEYAHAIQKILRLYDSAGGDACAELQDIRTEALESISRFSQDKFIHGFSKAITSLV